MPWMVHKLMNRTISGLVNIGNLKKMYNFMVGCLFFKIFPYFELNTNCDLHIKPQMLICNLFNDIGCHLYKLKRSKISEEIRIQYEKYQNTFSCYFNSNLLRGLRKFEGMIN